jgi:hypothetical protein
MSGVLDAAASYIGAGLSVVPIPSGVKRPIADGWQNLRIGIEDIDRHFRPDSNIGVILGPASGDLVDIDLDCVEALELADLYLPETGAEFGRASKPRSHRLYAAAGETFATFGDKRRDKKNTLLEYRTRGATGGEHQTIFPPSVADGEIREWHGDVIAAAAVAAGQLKRRCAWLAIGCLVMRYVSAEAARLPGPDLPAMLYRADKVLGRDAYHWLGMPDPEPKRHLQSSSRDRLSADDVSLAEIVEAIPNNEDWEGWNNVGMAIFVASDGSGHGGTVFDNWSAKSPKYNPSETVARWAHYHRSPPFRTGIDKLIALALRAGWRPPPSQKDRRAAA